MSSDSEELGETPGPPEARSSEPVPSGRRRSSESPLAQSWRDVLLRLSLSLPIDVELEQLTREFADGLASILPNAAIGACVVSTDGAGPVVVSRMPVGMAVSVGRDPTRLFPGFHDERIFELEDGATGSTLHLASPLQALSPLQTQIGTHAALVLAAATRRARKYFRAEESARSIRKLQAQVIQNEKLASLGQIVAGVVHELNNPLTSIIAYSDYLTKKLAKDPSSNLHEDAERVRRIGEAAERILKFTRDLVAYARPTGDARGPVQIEEVIERALLFCEHEFADGRVEVDREFTQPLPLIFGIPGQLTQVFVNLFTNAAHAMGNGG
ncbi:MAG TPA: histidine kinase dimerization/phospho-acceptor domain-containing protein, partial [Polyangiaceae bacterium]